MSEKPNKTKSLSKEWSIKQRIVATFIVPMYFFAKYVWSSLNKLSYDLKINQTVSLLKWRIESLSPNPNPKVQIV